MKKLNKLQINPEKLMNNEELKSLGGGSGSLECYEWGSMEQCGGRLIGYFNSPCWGALAVCQAMGGSCVVC